MKIYVGFTVCRGVKVTQIATTDRIELIEKMRSVSDSKQSAMKCFVQIWGEGKRAKSIPFSKFERETEIISPASLEGELEDVKTIAHLILNDVEIVRECLSVYQIYPESPEKEKVLILAKESVKYLNQAGELIDRLSDEVISMHGY